MAKKKSSKPAARKAIVPRIVKPSSLELSPYGLGLSLSIIWGLCVFLSTLVSYFFLNGRFGWILASIYPGYTVTPLGAVGGLLYGLIDGFILGALVAWLYNKAR